MLERLISDARFRLESALWGHRQRGWSTDFDLHGLDGRRTGFSGQRNVEQCCDVVVPFQPLTPMAHCLLDQVGQAFVVANYLLASAVHTIADQPHLLFIPHFESVRISIVRLCDY